MEHNKRRIKKGKQIDLNLSGIETKVYMLEISKKCIYALRKNGSVRWH